MSAGWGRIWRLKTLVEKTAYQLLQNTPRESKEVDFQRGYQFVSRGLKTSPVWMGYRYTPSTVESHGVWNLLHNLGLSECRIYRIKRFFRRYSIPWLKYSIPAAFVLISGDLIAQYYMVPNMMDMSLVTFFERCWNKERTMVYFLTGLLLVGPLLSWWNLMWFRKLRCKRKLTYIFIKTFFDVLVLGPLLIALMAIIYDQTKRKDNINNEGWEKVRNRIQSKYLPAVKEVVYFNLLSRPVMAMFLCYVAPPHLRSSLRMFYEIMLAAFLSRAFYNHRLRPEPPPHPSCPTLPPEEEPSTADQRSLLSKIWNWPC